MLALIAIQAQLCCALPSCHHLAQLWVCGLGIFGQPQHCPSHPVGMEKALRGRSENHMKSQ